MELIKLRMQIWWEIFFFTTWKWLILAPLAILGIFQSVRDEFFSTAIQEKYKLLKAIPHISLAWYIVIVLVFVLITVLESAYRSIIKRDEQLKAFISEYAYSFQLMRVDQEEQHAKNTNDYIISRKIRCLLRLKNTLNRPIQYSVFSFEINGIFQSNPLSTGGIITALGEATYYSHFVNLPIDSIGRLYNTILTVVIFYGPPDKNPTRKIYKKIHLESINEKCTMLYEKDTDDALDV